MIMDREAERDNNVFGGLRLVFEVIDDDFDSSYIVNWYRQNLLSKVERAKLRDGPRERLVLLMVH